MKKPTTPPLQLSLQWGDRIETAAHRASVTRTLVSRTLKRTLQQGLASLQQQTPPPVLPSQCEITVRIVGEAVGRSLNLQYRQRDYATNVLTFDYDFAPVLLADIVLCAPVVARQAQEEGKTIGAHYVHLIVHGMLHALGFDHERSRAEAQQMEALEVAVLRDLGLDNPYEAHPA